MGHPYLGVAVAAGGVSEIRSGNKIGAVGTSQRAKGAVVESLVATARGGSAALGMRGIVPAKPGQQSSLDLGSSLAAATGMTQVAPVPAADPSSIVAAASGLAPVAALSNPQLAAARVAMGQQAASRATGEMARNDTAASSSGPGARAPAQPPQTDGMTKGYTRRDKQGALVEVHGYKTPERRK